MVMFYVISSVFHHIIQRLYSIIQRIDFVANISCLVGGVVGVSRFKRSSKDVYCSKYIRK